MYGKALALFALVAAVNGVQFVSDPHVGAQSEQTIRGLGYFGQGSISHQSKAVDGAFSSVRKYDTRVTNNAVYASPVAHAAYAAPVAHHAYAAPVAHHAYAAPVAHHAYAAPAYAAPVAHHAYAAPVAHAYAPAVAKVAAPVAYAPHAYAAPVAHHAYAAPVAHHAYAAPVGHAKTVVSGLGVAYSAVSPAVATATFDGFGVHYGY